MDNNADLDPAADRTGARQYPGVKIQSCEKWRCGSDDTERTLKKNLGKCQEI